jgi:L-lactate dehydrogenase complex protein LldE
VTALTKPLNLPKALGDAKIGLFIPCYIDLIYPEVGIAALELLGRFGLDVEYPLNQTITCNYACNTRESGHA